jgi:hypothetical protein
LNQYSELRDAAQDEMELALVLAEHSLFVDAASGEPKARQFLLSPRGVRASQRCRRIEQFSPAVEPAAEHGGHH